MRINGCFISADIRKTMENDLKRLLIKHGFSFKKCYGQNFLTDRALLKEIVEKAGVTEDDVVLEIGCGAGALTRELSASAKKVYGYEIDEKLKPVLKESLGDSENVEIIFKDVMKENLSDLEERLGDGYMLVANLPYYITTPLIMNFLENGKKIKKLVVMVQEEVADRLVAKSGSSDYGAITVAVDFYGSAEKLLRVGREMFSPSPNVDSAVVSITVDREKFKDYDYSSVKKIVRTGFNNRRKMFINNFMKDENLSRDDAEKILGECGIPVTARGETFSAEDYCKIAKTTEKFKKCTK